jgi:hypothetical protein
MQRTARGQPRWPCLPRPSSAGRAGPIRCTALRSNRTSGLSAGKHVHSASHFGRSCWQKPASRRTTIGGARALHPRASAHLFLHERRCSLVLSWVEHLFWPSTGLAARNTVYTGSPDLENRHMVDHPRQTLTRYIRRGRGKMNLSIVTVFWISLAFEVSLHGSCYAKFPSPPGPGYRLDTGQAPPYHV